jgi:hypothetical protein
MGAGSSLQRGVDLLVQLLQVLSDFAIPFVPLASYRHLAGLRVTYWLSSRCVVAGCVLTILCDFGNDGSQLIRLVRTEGWIVDILEDEAGTLPGDERDSIIYRVEPSTGEELDLRHQSIRAPIQ